MSNARTPPRGTATSLTPEEVAQAFAALGSEPRLSVLLTLVRAGPDGLTVGDIQKRLAVPASTLTHHLRFLTSAGVIAQERDGRMITCRAAYDRIEALAGYLTRECCADQPEADAPATKTHTLKSQTTPRPAKGATP
ncbi:MAG: metalloregulator ArsR/SmtB family transcription factor [Pseudomonadota bacterium]